MHHHNLRIGDSSPRGPSSQPSQRLIYILMSFSIRSLHSTPEGNLGGQNTTQEILGGTEGTLLATEVGIGENLIDRRAADFHP